MDNKRKYECRLHLKVHRAFLSTVCITISQLLMEHNVHCIIHVHVYCTFEEEKNAQHKSTINENVTDFIAQTRLPVQIIVSCH